MSFIDTTQQYLEAAMRGSMERQSLLSNNLANADTADYKPEDVDFQGTLEQALASGDSASSVAFSPYTEDQVTQSNGNGVDSDETNAQIAENGLLYEDLTQIAAAREGILETAMNTTTSA